MDRHEARTGRRISYGDVAEATGLSLATIESIGSREHYNATLAIVAKLCRALSVDIAEILELRDS